MKKRVLSLLLALTMLIGMTPAAFAVGTSFSDVSDHAWYYNAVNWAVENNITGGIGNGMFGPDQTCTRAQVVVFLWAAADKPEPKSTVSPFTDVKESDWFFKAVMWAVENNITGGTSATTFSPNAPCTRAAVATFLYAAQGKPGYASAEGTFTDVGPKDWFYAPVAWAVENNVTGGIGNGKFGPNQSCTRAQIATFLWKADQIGETPVLPDKPDVSPVLPDTPTPPPAVEKFKVTFLSKDGTVLKEETVESGKSANAPANIPQIDGYRFTGWDVSFDNVTSDLTVTAQYEKIQLEANEYNIEYNLSGNSMYLQELEAQGKIDNSGNPVTYKEGERVALLNPEVSGYNFKGWYDSAGSNANRVYHIEDRIGTVQLYAQWELVEYKIMFKSDLIPVDSDTYNVEEGKVLPVPHLDGYIFVGWSDDDGNILKQIPAGTVGHKTYSANWLSERNQAWAKNKIGDPIIVEEDGKILFIYEIGEIRNVPLTLIHDFGKINDNGVSKKVTKTYSTTISEEYMLKYNKTVSKSTTDSFGWALDSGWSEGVSVNEEWAKENNISVEEAKERCTNDEENWYVSSGQSGSKTTVTLDTTDTHNLTTNTKNTKTYDVTDEEDHWDNSAELDIGYKSMKTVKADAKVAEGGKGSEFSIGGSLKGTYGSKTNIKTGTEEDEGKDEESGTIHHGGTTTTDVSSWNAESGTGGSHSVSNTDSVSTAVSEAISNKTGYGKEYIIDSNENVSQQTATTKADSEETSAGVTWGKVVTEEITEEYETSNTMSGYHRWVIAGTAHVFGVVGYDVETSSYFVSTYSVMDSETHEFEDYSYSYASYDDNQSGQIPFNVPDDIVDYVVNRTLASDGLEVSKDGVITDYFGTDDFVVIPEYTAVQNIDGTVSAIKIVGLDAKAFQDKDFIKVIELSDYIDVIPEDAFRNCSSLIAVEGEGLTTIGARAFAGCSSLQYCTIGSNVTELGVGVFEGMKEAEFYVSDGDVAKAAVQCGAKNIKLYIQPECSDLNNMTLTIPAGVESFTFHGSSKTFNDLVIDSAADTTVISGTTINSTAKTPLRLASDAIVLQEVNVTAPGLAMISAAQDAKIALYGKSSLSSDNENAILSRKLAFDKYEIEGQSVYSHLTIKGNLLICGEKVSSSLMTIDPGNQIEIDEDEFESYQKGSFTVHFEPNGGTVALENKTVYYGQTYGELPTPERGEAYVFEGWYTKKDGGSKVTADTAAKMDKDVTLYAHWKLNQFTVTFDANGGTVSEGSRKVTCSKQIGTLPEPSKDFHRFDGWYTEKDGGSKITEKSTWSTAKDVTLYAHWVGKDVSGWVPVNEMPEGAEVMDEMWRYDLTTIIESEETAVEGYTRTGNERWVQGDYGKQQFANFPGGFDTGHTLYQNLANGQPYTAYETETEKREVKNDWAGYIYWHWMYNCGGAKAYDRLINHGYTNKWHYFGAFTSTNGYEQTAKSACTNRDCVTFYVHDRKSHADTQGSYYWFRFDYYNCSYTDYYKMFEYKKVETLESKAPVTASDTISNVQKLVQYREK